MITVFIGHRGTGKTSLLKRLEVLFSKQGAVFKDLDDEIETMHRRSIDSIFAAHGEAEFRKLEKITFEKLMQEYSSHPQVYIAMGAGFEFDLPKGVHVIWVRRVTDPNGRIFLNRPKLSDRDPMLEWKTRFAAREPRYRAMATEELTLPEGGLHDNLLEEHFFTDAARPIPYGLTILPENFRSDWFFEHRRSWGLKWLEIRDDLLSGDQIKKVEEIWPGDRLLYSIRKAPLAARPSGVGAVDWALELGTPSFVPEILSLHQRDGDFNQTLEKSQNSNGVFKLAVEVKNFPELLAGHRWWLQKPDARAFLPRSGDGRWQWYRQLFGPRMPLHFFREGDGSSPDQPYLWQTLAGYEWKNDFAAILGSPVTQSWTPTFQREFFMPHSIPVVAVRVEESEWDEALQILREMGLRFAAVTSPLKKLAFVSSTEKSESAKRFESVNTMARSEAGWAGHNSDISGAQKLLNSGLSAYPILVWGGGGTKQILQAVLPAAEFVPARAGKKLTEPVHVVWAVGRKREFVWPEPAHFLQSVVDLNYSEDSPGREIAQRAGCPYKSGETMFIHQGLQQREFWKRFF